VFFVSNIRTPAEGVWKPIDLNLEDVTRKVISQYLPINKNPSTRITNGLYER